MKGCSAEANTEKAIRQVGRVRTLAEEPSEGVFVSNERTYKVQQSGKGHFYAKVFDPEAQVFEYVGRRPLNYLTEDDRITAEAAARFGQVTGQCVFCFRKLTDERSITVGYGQVCATHNHLPWGTLPEAV
ncbi:MAG: DUF6011 domain-containing protein [Nocardioidaceae bacterium]